MDAIHTIKAPSIVELRIEAGAPIEFKFGTTLIRLAGVQAPEAGTSCAAKGDGDCLSRIRVFVKAEGKGRSIQCETRPGDTTGIPQASCAFCPPAPLKAAPQPTAAPLCWDLSLQLIRNGLARPDWTYLNASVFAQSALEADADAKAHKLGLWSR